MGALLSRLDSVVAEKQARAMAEGVTNQLPPALRDLADGSEVRAKVGFEPVKVDGGTWSFKAWDYDAQTVNGSDVAFVGTWRFEKDPEPAKYKATFEFVADDGSKLPEGVTAQLPPALRDLADGSEVRAKVGFEPVGADGGTWSFKAWDYDAQTVNGSDVAFVGTWRFDKDEPENPQQPEKPQNPGEPQQPENPGNPQQPAKVLPQMGDSSALLPAALGASSLAALAGGLLLRRGEV